MQNQPNNPQPQFIPPAYMLVPIPQPMPPEQLNEDVKPETATLVQFLCMLLIAGAIILIAYLGDTVR